MGITGGAFVHPPPIHTCSFAGRLKATSALESLKRWIRHSKHQLAAFLSPTRGKDLLKPADTTCQKSQQSTSLSAALLPLVPQMLYTVRSFSNPFRHRDSRLPFLSSTTDAGYSGTRDPLTSFLNFVDDEFLRSFLDTPDRAKNSRAQEEHCDLLFAACVVSLSRSLGRHLLIVRTTRHPRRSFCHNH